MRETFHNSHEPDRSEKLIRPEGGGAIRTPEISPDLLEKRLSEILPDTDRLKAVRETALMDVPSEEAFDRFTRLASRVLDIPVALISLIDDERHHFKSTIGLPEPDASSRERPMAKSFCQYTIALGHPLVIENASEHSLVCDNPATEEFNIGGYMGVPLVTSDGHGIGNFCAIDTEPRQWTKQQLETLEDLAASVMREIEARAANQKLEAARREARETERRLRKLVGDLNAIVWEADVSSFEFTYISPQAEEILGYPPEQWIGELDFWSDIIHPDDGQEVANYCRRHVQNGQSHTVEFRAQTVNDEVIWLESIANVITDETGNPETIRGVMVDITERKRAQQLQEEQTRLLKLIASETSLDECLSALCEAVPRLNPGVRASILLADEEGSSFQQSVAPDLRPSWAEGLEGAPINDLMIGTCGEAVFRGKPVICEDIANDEQWSEEWRELCAANGIAAGYSVPIRSEENEPLGSFMLCFDEPRTPNAREEQLAEFGARIASIALEQDRSRQALRESKERLASRASDMERLHALSTKLLRQDDVEAALHEVMEASAELLRADKASTQIYDNSEEILRLVSVLGFDQDFIDQFQVVNTGSITTCAAALERGEQVLVDDLSADPDYTEFYRKVSRYDARAAFSAPLYDSDDQLLGMFTMYWEDAHRPSEDQLKLLDLYTRQAARLIERRRAEEQLREAKEEAEKTASLRSNLLANVSHEIRTPITGILGLAENLEDKVAEDRREEVRLIEKSGRRLMDTFDSVLALAQLEGGEVEVDAKRVNVTEEVEEIAESFRPLAEEKGLSLEVTSSAPTTESHLDPALLGRILDNLLSNAIKFTDDGGVTVEVTATNEDVSIAVTDTGLGISEEFQDRLFDEFTQESTGFSRSHEGIGLGLPLTKKMAEQLGGEISVASEKGEGSQFTVTFPRAAIEDRSSEREMTADSREAPTERQEMPTTSVLLIEDNRIIRRVIVERLGERHGYEVEAFAEAEPALERAEDRAFDVILIDISLPGIDGMEALRRLRSTDTYSERPIIAVTGHALPGDRERFLAEGFSEHMGKPFSADELAEKIRSLET